jgi:hypothetical protein
MRECVRCGNPIPAERRADAAYCSDECGRRMRNKRYADKYPELVKRRREFANSQTQRRILIRVKSRAKRLGIPFNLELTDIAVPEVCPILGIKLATRQGRQGFYPDSPSLDRIDPKQGYIKGNVRVISARANLLKNDATIEELEAVLRDLRALTRS